MHADIQLAIAGAAAGSLIALMATGLILQFRSSGVLNLGHGAIATLAGYLFTRTAGTWGWPAPLALALAVVLAAVVAGVFQLVVLRPMVTAPLLAKVVATLGLMLLISSSVQPLFGRRQQPRTGLVGEGVFTLPYGDPSFVVSRNRVYYTVVTTVLCLSLWALYRFSRFGRATRAAADNQRAAQILGYSAQRLEFINWTVGGALAGLVGVLLATLTPPTPTNYTLFLVAAVAVALVARFQSFSIMLAAGIGVGAVQAILLRRSEDLRELTGLGGWGEALPLAVIIVGVLISGRAILGRGQREERPLPDAPVARRPLRGAGIALVVGLLWIAFAPAWLIDPTSGTMILTILALSIVVLTGYSGQVSLAQLSIAGFGAFVAAKVATIWNLPFPLPVLAAGLGAAVLACALGAPAVRVRGINLAVVTLAAAIVMDVMFFADRNLTGADGGMRMPTASFLGIDLNGLTSRRQFAVAALVIAVLCGLAVAYIRRSSLGHRMLAIRANERGAAATGVSVATVKLVAFTLAGFLAGVAGSLEGYRSLQISWSRFDFFASLLIVAFAYMGGTTYISGAVATGLIASGGILAAVFHFQGSAAAAVEILGGIGVIIVVLLHPAGLGHDGQRLYEFVRRAITSRRPTKRDTSAAPPAVRAVDERSTVGS